MSRAVTKLASFKQSVMESLANDEDALGLNMDRGVGMGRLGNAVDVDGSMNSNASPSRRDSHTPSVESMKKISGMPGYSAASRPGPSSSPAPASISPVPSQPAPAAAQLQVPPLRKNSTAVTFSGLDGGSDSALTRPKSPSPSATGSGGLGVAAAGATPAGAGEQASPGVVAGAVDGREFFKKARASLSYDERGWEGQRERLHLRQPLSAHLPPTPLPASVTSVHDPSLECQSSRYRTLEAIGQLLGDRHPDLLNQFEGLLGR
ncbi:hypothetical protein BDK51DRAFT_37126 [Blyttiomyces helicus]|uniref:Uncharacterized protein n=1 Tax=Blyttiomyces helicus TaxID=388810 RepID=A0A4P9WI15_9FUNG|nr:hypothetical protein BDK51DRAFT_37126 [Blyttiomyces helicus]|eukprot:RKO92042.1 hypothetical protein BDK51DRAFT_37126 [Blyttiomyces helicus]